MTCSTVWICNFSFHDDGDRLACIFCILNIPYYLRDYNYYSHEHIWGGLGLDGRKILERTLKR